jgi:glycosyltransferase involved in cell wall biosynthesis
VNRSRGRLILFTPGHADIGGVARRSRMLAEEFARRGWEVRVIARAPTARRLRIERSADFVNVELPGFAHRRFGAAVYVYIALVLGAWWGRRARLLVAVQLSAPSLAASLLGVVFRRPFLILSSTCGSVSEVRELQRRRLYTWRVRLLARATCLVGQTKEATDELSSFVPGGTTAVIPNPVAAVAAPPPLSDEPVALFAGRFAEEKDLPGLLVAWKMVAAANPNARLVLAGSGGSYRSVEAEIRNIVTSDSVLRRSVELPGWQSDLGPFFHRAPVFVFPSLSEGMSNALLEACAYGRIVVASDIAGNRAVLGDDYPLLFPAGDAERMACLLEYAFASSDYRARALDAITKRMDLFTPARVVSSLEALALPGHSL